MKSKKRGKKKKKIGTPPKVVPPPKKQCTHQGNESRRVTRSQKVTDTPDQSSSLEMTGTTQGNESRRVTRSQKATDTPDQSSSLEMTGTIPTEIACTAFGKNRRSKFPDAPFCDNCDSYEKDSPLFSSQCKRTHRFYKCLFIGHSDVNYRHRSTEYPYPYNPDTDDVPTPPVEVASPKDKRRAVVKNANKEYCDWESDEEGNDPMFPKEFGILTDAPPWLAEDEEFCKRISTILPDGPTDVPVESNTAHISISVMLGGADTSEVINDIQVPAE